MRCARFIHTGARGCTYTYQRSMPKLPIPELDKTCARWLKAVTPLAADAAELATTTAAVEAFRVGPGPALQEKLRARDAAAPESSFINDWWEEMYLCDRSPLPYNINPFLELAPDARTRDPCVRAAALVEAAMHVHCALRTQTLEPDVYHMGTVAQSAWFKRGVLWLPAALRYPAAYMAKSYPLDMTQVRDVVCVRVVPFNSSAVRPPLRHQSRGACGS